MQKSRTKKNPHTMRKLAALRKKAARYKDGKGWERKQWHDLKQSSI